MNHVYAVGRPFRGEYIPDPTPEQIERHLQKIEYMHRRITLWLAAKAINETG